MEYVPVTSSNVAALAYSNETQTLGVKFLNGSEYHYQNVPSDVYTNMLSAESVGKFLHQNVKGIYPYQKVG